MFESLRHDEFYGLVKCYPTSRSRKHANEFSPNRGGCPMPGNRGTGIRWSMQQIRCIEIPAGKTTWRGRGNGINIIITVSYVYIIDIS